MDLLKILALLGSVGLLTLSGWYFIGAVLLGLKLVRPGRWYGQDPIENILWGSAMLCFALSYFLVGRKIGAVLTCASLVLLITARVYRKRKRSG